MSNYPDNIRDFDNHPMSPFYEEPLSQCEYCLEFREFEDMRTESCCNACAEELEDGQTG